jgi:hypothetical protein
MTDRDRLIVELRPILVTIKKDSSSSELEIFQNQSIRPILKLQHPLIIKIFQAYVIQHKVEFNALELSQKLEIIHTSFSKDVKLRSHLNGLVLGHLTEYEFDFYTAHASQLNKRIISMIKQRIIDSIQII